MKAIVTLLPSLMILLCKAVNAEVITDGSVGKIQSLSGSMVIPQDLGKIAGNNLFHSFKTFNINSGESATFTGADSLKNVISRVTGGEVSTINGLLKSEVGNANFYFINPAGVTFGENAKVDVPAAFHVSTANVLRFADGINFDTTANPPSRLSVSLPYEFGFLGNQSGNIKIQGTTLYFANRNPVSLSAANLTINDAKLYDFAGDISLYTVGKTTANISYDGHLLANRLAGQLKINNSDLHTDNFQTAGYTPGHLSILAGNININNSTLSSWNWQTANAEYETGINIAANSLSLDNSYVETKAFSSGNAPNIKLFVKQGSLLLNNESVIGSNTYYETGNAGTVDVVVENGQLSIANGSKISSFNYSGNGNASDVTVKANNILIDRQNSEYFTGILSDSSPHATGNAGNVSVTSNHQLTIKNNGQISSETYSSGHAGKIFVQGDNILLDTTGKITSEANRGSSGNAGNMEVIANNQLTLQQGGNISSATWGNGDSGNVTVTAKDITIENAHFITPSGEKAIAGIYSTAEEGTSNSGNITIDSKTGKLTLKEGGAVSSSTWTSGKAGSITVDAEQLVIDGKGKNVTTAILSDALEGSTGKAGNVTLNIDKDISLAGGGSITSSTKGQGNAGSVNIVAGGNITVDSSNAFENAQGRIITKIASSAYTENSTGNAGNVNITANNIGILNGGLITSGTWGAGNAGNVTIHAKQMQIEGADSSHLTGISTTTFLPSSVAKGGGISISADKINLNGGDINSDTQSKGDAGEVIINVKNGLLSLVNGGSISSDTNAEGDANTVKVTAKEIFIDRQGSLYTTGIMSDAQWQSTKGNAGNVFVTSDKLTVQNGGQITSATFAKGNAGTIHVNANQIIIDDGKNSNFFTGISSYSDSNSSGNAGSLVINAADTLTLLNQAEISSTTFSPVGIAGSVKVNAGIMTLDEGGIFAGAGENSSGQTGSINVTAKHSVNLLNDSLISLQNIANVNNPTNIAPTKLTVTAPDINLTDSKITTASSGNVDASNIELNFSHWLTLDPSFITTSANSGNGGTITIKGGEVINLQNSGFLTSVADAKGNGGNINVAADVLVMNTGVIQANAVGGSGGDINLNLKALIPSQNTLIKGGEKVEWSSAILGFNVIQAVSESGVNGSINLTSPQFDISGSLSGLNASGLVLPMINRNPCQKTIGSSLTRGSRGGVPLHNEKTVFFPPAIFPQSQTLPNIKTEPSDNLSDSNQYPHQVCTAI